MDRIQLISIIASIIIFSVVFNLVRRRKLKTEYSLIWLSVAVIFIVFSFWREGIDKLAKLLGIAYAPSVLFIILLIGIILILIEFSIIISKQAEKIKILVQEIGLLKQELEEKIEKIKPADEGSKEKDKQKN
ncbi:MAG: DUF2304 domain-containing protein [Prolixibacteraceae bacterium]|nr:DUF2304 domain-containing protein [Prolixibacteraceae bacterium]